MPKSVLLVVPLLLVTMIGCTGDDPVPAPPGPLPSVTHPAVEVPQDRPKRAVVAGLTQLDACAFLDPAKAKVPGFPAGVKPVPTAPHQCQLETPEQKVYATLGTTWSRQRRFDSEMITTGGVTTYFEKSPGWLCRAAVPVSFSHTIEFRTNAHGVKAAEKCERVRAFAAAAVTALADPDTVAARLPLAGWDACGVLARALGAKVGGSPLVLGDASHGIDRCVLAGTAASTILELEYDSPPEQRTKDTFVTVDGKKVRVYRTPACMLTWNQGPSGVPDPDHAAEVVSVTASDCTGATAVVKAVMAVLSGPDPAKVAPQRPLVFRSGEPDAPVAGACVDLPATYQCEPYHEVPAPRGTTEVTRRAAADRNVDCAIAVEPVRRHFGPSLKPVTSAGRTESPGTDGVCVFVEPTHATQVWISVAAGPTDGTVVVDDGRNPVNTTVKDRQGTRLDHTEGGVAGISIAIPVTDDPNGPVLQGRVMQHHPRGTRSDKPPAADTTRKLDPVLTEILTDNFG